VSEQPVGGADASAPIHGLTAGPYCVQTSTKAVLLSALVFPGTGHVLLRKYGSGLALITIAFVALYYLISKAIEQALAIAEQIQIGELVLDAAQIMEMVSNQSIAADAQWIRVATAVFVVCWLVGIVDCYRIGRMPNRDPEDVLDG